MENELSARSSSDVAASSSGSSSRTKRPRAKTVGKRVASLAPGDKLTFVFDLSHRPIGEYKPDYVTRQGVVVRNMHITSLAYKSWHKVLQETKQKMVDAILFVGKFNIGPEVGRLYLLTKSLGQKWKDYRSELKVLYYDKCGPDENRLRNRSPGVLESDWIWLVRYWGSEDVQELCRKNKEHRSVQQMHNHTGRKSFAVIAKNERASTKSLPSRLKMFELTYKKNDVYPNLMAQRMVDEIHALTTTQEKGLNSLDDDDVFTHVFGKDRGGHVRCMGMSCTPSTVFGSQPSKGNIIRELNDVRKVNEEVLKDDDDLRRRVFNWEGRLEGERRKWQADSNAQIERVREESKAQMEEMMTEVRRLFSERDQQ